MRIRYDGATTIGLHLLPELLPLYERAGHGVSHVGERGTNRGLDAVRAGEVDVAGVMREISASERAEPLRWALVGYDALGVFVHAANPVRSLTRAQPRGSSPARSARGPRSAAPRRTSYKSRSCAPGAVARWWSSGGWRSTARTTARGGS